jgi:ribosomal protein L11 methyltransferase
MNDDGTPMTERPRSWLEVQVETAPEAAEIMTAELTEIAEGVESRDAGTVIKAPPGRALAIVHVPPEELDALKELVAGVADRLREAEVPVDPVDIRVRPAHEDEWRDVWKQFFRATRVGRTFVVRPSWDRGELVTGDRVIDIDPGRAFGTGGHASTRLVIALAEELANRWEKEGRPVTRFLDLGCGSGILSIAACLLWRHATGQAVDLDPESSACAAENLERNQIARVQTATGSLDLVPADGTCDVILANIQADVLASLAPGFPSRLRPGGHALLSGLLLRDAEPVWEVFRELGFSRVLRKDEGDWAALDLAYAASPPQGAASPPQGASEGPLRDPHGVA